MNLFQTGVFTLHSGGKTSLKIDCDALTDADIDTIAAQLTMRLHPFSSVQGIPTGGTRLSKAMTHHFQPNGGTLIVDDVWTTGSSMYEAYRQLDSGYQKHPEWNRPNLARLQGAVIFARSTPVSWVVPMFTMTPL